MITSYKNIGERVDEVLYQEVMRVIEVLENGQKCYSNEASKNERQLLRRIDFKKENNQLRSSINKSIAHFRQDEHPEGMYILEQALE